MKALGAGDGFGFWRPARRGDGRRRRASGQGAGGVPGGETAGFPLKQAATAGSLALIGDAIAQLRERWERQRESGTEALWLHDWVRALRMTSYGFLLYGPGSYAWYRLLDRLLPQKNGINLSAKVVLNQVVLGPMVILVIFAWNSLWQGRLSDLLAQYQQKAIPTLVDGWKFWTPASVLNFRLGGPDPRLCAVLMGYILFEQRCTFGCEGSVHVVLLHLLELLSVHRHEEVAPVEEQFVASCRISSLEL